MVASCRFISGTQPIRLSIGFVISSAPWTSLRCSPSISACACFIALTELMRICIRWIFDCRRACPSVIQFLSMSCIRRIFRPAARWISMNDSRSAPAPAADDQPAPAVRVKYRAHQTPEPARSDMIAEYMALTFVSNGVRRSALEV